MSKPHFNLTAIIYDKKGNVLSIGQNSYIKTHPLQAKLSKKFGNPHKEFLHAEISAITKCPNLNKAYKIMIFRYHADGTVANAKPCEVCNYAIRNLTPIKKIEYTMEEEI